MPEWAGTVETEERVFRFPVGTGKGQRSDAVKPVVAKLRRAGYAVTFRADGPWHCRTCDRVLQAIGRGRHLSFTLVETPSRFPAVEGLALESDGCTDHDIRSCEGSRLVLIAERYGGGRQGGDPF